MSQYFDMVLMVFCCTITHYLLGFIALYVDYTEKVRLHYYMTEVNCLKNIYKPKCFTCNRIILSTVTHFTSNLCMMTITTASLIIVSFIVKNIYHVKNCFIYRYKMELKIENSSHLICKDMEIFYMQHYINRKERGFYTVFCSHIPYALQSSFYSIMFKILIRLK
jgi:hypothetical protein